MPTVIPPGLIVLLATSISTVALLPGIDPDTLIGSFAGSTLFVVSAPDLPLWRRLIYLMISLALGYLAAPELLRWLPFVQSPGLAAFIASATGISLTLGLIERSREVNVLDHWLGRERAMDRDNSTQRPPDE